MVIEWSDDLKKIRTTLYLARTAECENGTNLRQRRQDRIEKTQQMITAIKEKQKEIEKKADNSIMLQTGSKWLGVGVGIFVLVCVGFRYFQG